MEVEHLPAPRAPEHSAAVLPSALAVAFHDPAICCGKDSALEDSVAAEHLSLSEAGSRIGGDHRLADGHSIRVTADYIPPGAINPDIILDSLRDQRPLLLEWDSHLYVLYGAIYNETRYTSGRREFAITKLLLLDPRYTGARRHAEFDRAKDDWTKIEGLLTVAADQKN
jgi:hypothetical protein